LLGAREFALERAGDGAVTTVKHGRGLTILFDGADAVEIESGWAPGGLVKQVLQNRSGMTVVRDVPAPPCPSAGVLVRNLYSAISAGTESARVEPGGKSLLARARERPDLVKHVVERARREGLRRTRAAVQRKLGEETPSGYSSVGRVLEVGAAVEGISPGDIVACAGAGHANHAEVVAVPRNLVARVPEGVPLPAASLTTIAAVALHGVRLADVRLGESVAVVGCGLVGQITCRLLRAAGAEVIALDVDAARVAHAVAAGADHGVLADEEATRRVADPRRAGAWTTRSSRPRRERRTHCVSAPRSPGTAGA
jgi:hypothetical protein